MFKKFLAVLLAAVMIFAFAAVPALAADGAGSPTDAPDDDIPDALLWIIIAAGAVLVIIIIAVLVSKKK